LKIIISAIPGTIEVALPDSLFKNNPIVLDVAYNPKETSLIKQALKNKCEYIIYGIEMLLYQGYMQQEIFTGY